MSRGLLDELVEARLIERALEITADEVHCRGSKEQLAQRFLRFITESTTADCATYREYDKNRGTLRHVASHGVRQPKPNREFDVADPLQSIGAYVFVNQRTEYCPDTTVDPAPDHPRFACRYMETRSYISTPATALHTRHGVVSAHSVEVDSFSAAEQRFVEVIAKLMAISFDLLDKERQLEDTMTIVAHQTIGPLNGIWGHCKNLSDGIYKGQKIGQIHAILVDVALRTISATDNILYLSKIIAGGVGELRKEDCVLVQILIDAAKTYQGEARYRGISIAVKESTIRGGLLLADEQLLRQAISNLLDNAVKYSDPGTTIEISVSKSLRWFKISIRNQGIPVRGSQKRQIFERGQESRSPEARERVPQGTGLGLWVVERIMELHGGKVIAEPTTASGSTVFHLAFANDDFKDTGGRYE